MSYDVFRPGPAELDALSELFNAYRQFYRRESDVARCRVFINERMAKQDSVLKMLRHDGVLKGFLQVYPTLSSISLGNIWLINDLYVDVGARGHGFGEALLNDVIEEANALSIVMLRISTEATNTNAYALYKKVGFEPDTKFKYLNYFI